MPDNSSLLDTSLDTSFISDQTPSISSPTPSVSEKSFIANHVIKIGFCAALMWLPSALAFPPGKKFEDALIEKTDLSRENIHTIQAIGSTLLLMVCFICLGYLVRASQNSSTQRPTKQGGPPDPTSWEDRMAHLQKANTRPTINGGNNDPLAGAKAEAKAGAGAGAKAEAEAEAGAGAPPLLSTQYEQNSAYEAALRRRGSAGSASPVPNHGAPEGNFNAETTDTISSSPSPRRN